LLLLWGVLDRYLCYQCILEKTQGAIKNVQSRDIGNTGHTRQVEDKQTKTKANNNITQIYKQWATWSPQKKLWWSWRVDSSCFL
jgi:hypothetical protein